MQMKTRTQGYSSMEYSLIGYRKNQGWCGSWMWLINLLRAG